MIHPSLRDENGFAGNILQALKNLPIFNHRYATK
jgi:hypothetical protein